MVFVKATSIFPGKQIRGRRAALVRKVARYRAGALIGRVVQIWEQESGSEEQSGPDLGQGNRMIAMVNADLIEQMA